MNLLVKLKLAEKQMVKNETDKDAPEELGFFHLTNLKPIEKFVDYYQNYHFKPGYQGFLKYDEKCLQTVVALLKTTEGQPVDAKGVVYLNFKDTMEKMKELMGPSFNIDAIDRLQQKGLFVKRQSNDKGGSISFFKPEFEEMIQNWKFLLEIDKWNEVGFVDLTDPKEKKMGESILTCPSCKAQASPTQKFCAECGQKLVAAAA